MGRRWGKTVLGSVAVLNVLRQHGAAAWVAPNYKNTRPLWREVKRVCAPLEKAGLMKINEAERTVTTHMGGFLGIYSGDNADSVRGEKFNLAVIDEASRISQEAHDDAIQPTLADYDGDEILISTPKGRNWFFKEWIKAKSDGKEAMAWQAPTSDNPSPNIRKAFEMARTRVPERTFRQEWLAEFIEDGSFFTNVEAVCSAPAKEPEAGYTYCIGVDWARASGGDYTVFAVMNATTKTMVHLQRINGADFETQKMKLKALVARYRVQDVLAEYNSMGGPLVEALQRDGLPVRGFTTTASTKHEIISALELAMDQKTITLLNDEVIKGELQAYEKTERAGGLPSYSAPDGFHDDCVIATALAWHAAQTGEGVAGFAMNYMR